MTAPDLTSAKARSKSCTAFVKDSKGATAVEFALVAAPFLALIIALFQTFLVFFAQQLLETVASQSARLVMTGQVQTQNMDQATFKQQVCGNIRIFFDCNSLMVDLQVANSWTSTNTGMPTLTYDSNGNVSNSWQFNAGHAGDIVVLRVMYVWPVMLGPLGFNLSNLSTGNRLLMASAAFQNEPSS
ncbi:MULTISPECIES: TadE/TadG family type IV pilus assembly protein [unclassified Bradyrhizobium]|uniref:TadE/TadG family type IV pilus assembly protein n=1 Tax=unclassified Bradyrhizobium TaxID=2631580 RepID=UPI002916FA8A|nr:MULTISPECIES: TadE/TadG family type IV pilus assembly protein [unclassified Bradyrhizobium]